MKRFLASLLMACMLLSMTAVMAEDARVRVFEVVYEDERYANEYGHVCTIRDGVYTVEDFSFGYSSMDDEKDTCRYVRNADGSYQIEGVGEHVILRQDECGYYHLAEIPVENETSDLFEAWAMLRKVFELNADGTFRMYRCYTTHYWTEPCGEDGTLVLKESQPGWCEGLLLESQTVTALQGLSGRYEALERDGMVQIQLKCDYYGNMSAELNEDGLALTYGDAVVSMTEIADAAYMGILPDGRKVLLQLGPDGVMRIHEEVGTVNAEDMDIQLFCEENTRFGMYFGEFLVFDFVVEGDRLVFSEADTGDPSVYEFVERK